MHRRGSRCHRLDQDSSYRPCNFYREKNFLNFFILFTFTILLLWSSPFLASSRSFSKMIALRFDPQSKGLYEYYSESYSDSLHESAVSKSDEYLPSSIRLLLIRQFFSKRNSTKNWNVPTYAVWISGWIFMLAVFMYSIYSKITLDQRAELIRRSTMKLRNSDDLSPVVGYHYNETDYPQLGNFADRRFSTSYFSARSSRSNSVSSQQYVYGQRGTNNSFINKLNPRLSQDTSVHLTRILSEEIWSEPKTASKPDKINQHFTQKTFVVIHHEQTKTDKPYVLPGLTVKNFSSNFASSKFVSKTLSLSLLPRGSAMNFLDS